MNIKILSLWTIVACCGQPLMAMNALSYKQDEVAALPERTAINLLKIREANPHLRKLQEQSGKTEASHAELQPKDIPQLSPEEMAEMHSVKLQQANPHRDPLYNAENEARAVLAQIEDINRALEDLVLQKDVIKQAGKLTKKEKEPKLIPLREKEYKLYEERKHLYATLKDNAFLKSAGGRQLRNDLYKAANKKIGKAEDIRIMREETN